MRREYLSSAVNLLTMSPKISNLNKADFHHFHLYPIDGAIDTSDAVLISAVFATRDHVDCRKMF